MGGFADFGLRITKGEFESTEGRVDRSFMPQVSTYSSAFFEQNRKLILAVADKVTALQTEIAAVLARRSKTA